MTTITINTTSPLTENEMLTAFEQMPPANQRQVLAAMYQGLSNKSDPTPLQNASDLASDIADHLASVLSENDEHLLWFLYSFSLDNAGVSMNDYTRCVRIMRDANIKHDNDLTRLPSASELAEGIKAKLA